MGAAISRNFDCFSIDSDSNFGKRLSTLVRLLLPISCCIFYLDNSVDGLKISNLVWAAISLNFDCFSIAIRV